jgi:predicted nucleic acid-binding protein
LYSFYVDASALAKRYSPEIGTPLMNHLFGSVPTNRLCVLNIGIAEVVAVLVRKRNAGRLAAALFAQAVLNVRTELVSPQNLNRVTADDSLVTAALPLIDAHSINATDGIILCSALDIAAALRSSADELALVASDQRLLRAAQAEGLVTFDPETQTQADLDALLKV